MLFLSIPVYNVTIKYIGKPLVQSHRLFILHSLLNNDYIILCAYLKNFTSWCKYLKKYVPMYVMWIKIFELCLMRAFIIQVDVLHDFYAHMINSYIIGLYYIIERTF